MAANPPRNRPPNKKKWVAKGHCLQSTFATLSPRFVLLNQIACYPRLLQEYIVM